MPRARSGQMVLLVLTAIGGWVYLHRLGDVPVYLSLDEAHFAVHADAIASTGRNLNGDRLPLFINLADPLGDRPDLPWGNTWYQPFLFYLIAAALKLLPLTEASIRTPTAILGGVVNIVLMYLAADRLFGKRRIAIAAAAMLAMCPASVVISRQALDYTCPIVFILAWLFCLSSFVRDPRLRYAIGTGLVLGVGCYSYITSWIMMPLYLVLSWVAFATAVRNPIRPAVASAVAFMLPLLAILPWLWIHPEMPGNLLSAYSISDPEHVSAIQAVRDGRGLIEVARRSVSVYWAYFDPSFLFLSGGASRKLSTGQAGVFLLPVAILLPIGVYALVRRDRRSWFGLTLVAGLFSAPLPATLKGTAFAIERTMALLPFAILISACGLAWLWESRRTTVRVLGTLLLVAQPLQFAGFYQDYLSDYRTRSALGYDPTAFGEAAPFLVDAAAGGESPAVYLTAPLYDVSAKWRFWVTRLGHPDLLSRTHYFDGNLAGLGPAPIGSLAVVPSEDAAVNAAVSSGEWVLARRVMSIDGQPTLAILRKTASRLLKKPAT